MTHSQSTLVGESMAIRRLREIVATIAPTRVPVLIEGATGTGKELVAALLHHHSRRDGSFVAFNVCALGESMFEDALFGHVRGAYTGAIGESLGFLREANGGTAFLDEISGLPLPLQAKLLRAVETGVFRPIGSSRDARSDFRTVAATNDNLEELVAANRFRADLAQRLSGIVLSVPSLADRVDDIPILAAYFAQRVRPGTELTRRAERVLAQRDWPGNVRELKQVIDAAMIFTRGTSLDVDALDIALSHRPRPTAPKTPDAMAGERDRMLELLARAQWDTIRLAASLGVHRTTVYRRVKRLGIRLPLTFRTRGLGAPRP